MKTNRMRSIDGYFGPPLCWLLSLFFRRKRDLPRSVRKILIIKMFGLGSIILMTPAIRAIRESYPGVRIYFMSFAEHEMISKIYGVCDEFIAVRKNNLFNFIADSLGNARRMKREKIDIVIDAEFFAKFTSIFSSLCRFAYLIGFYNRDLYRGRFLDKRCYFNQYYHMKRNFAELANTFCPPVKDLTLTSPEISSSVKEKVLKVIAENGLSGKKIVILNPNTSDMTPTIDRSWPLSNFAEMGRYLMGKGYGIAVIGGSGQIQRAGELARMCGPGAVSFAGKTDMEELAALIGAAFCLITNDSGPFHIAVSLDVPTMAFFGTDSPAVYGADDPIHTAFFKNVPCSPCLSVFNYKKGDCEFESRCIRDISALEVMTEFDKKENMMDGRFRKRARV